MDLYTTGPSLNFLSNSSHFGFKTVAAAESKESGNNNFQLAISIENSNSKAGAPKYSFNKTSSINKTTRNLTSASLSCSTIVAIMEGRGQERGQIGMASMDIRHSELTLCQFVDTSSYTLLKIRLNLYDPIEVILPEENERASSRVVLMDVIKKACPRAVVTALQRRYFNDSLGIELVKQLSAAECSAIDASVTQKYFCMSAVAALIKYVEYIQNILYAQHSLKLVYEAVEDSCLVDVSSWNSLDLIHGDLKQTKGSPNSLFEVLNYCVTPGGVRTLRSYLLQPSASTDVINTRLNVVQELVENQAMCERIRSVLSNLHDLQQLISMCTYVNVGQCSREDSKRVIRNKITQIVELKNLLEAVKKLSQTFLQSKSPFFINSRVKLTDSRLETIADFVNEKIAQQMQDRKRKLSVAVLAKDRVLFAVADSQHVLIDLARRTYQELVAKILEFGEAETKNLPGVELCYTQSRGFHFSMRSSDPYAIRLPPNCIQIVFNKTSLTFTTRDLIKYNDRLMQSEFEILQKSNLVLDHLVASVREHIPALYNCAELVSLLDYYTALAHYSSRVPTVRPTFETEICVKMGRHPILDHRKDVMPNDTFLSFTKSRMAIIAGPNMAGKSTYMRQVCMLQILAQMGCMVPAESASLILMTRIFSRVGHNDDMIHNLSGFAVEMSEMAVILQNADRSSLIIIDELARSTSTEEGIGICYAMCERLLTTGAFVLFATHFLDLAQLEVNYPGTVQNYHFQFSSRTNRSGFITFEPHPKLHEGPYKGPIYGLELAEFTNFPEKIIRDAREMAENMRNEKERSLSGVKDRTYTSSLPGNNGH